MVPPAGAPEQAARRARAKRLQPGEGMVACPCAPSRPQPGRVPTEVSLMRPNALPLSCLLVLLAGGGPAMALDLADIPAAEPNDAVMARPEEVRAMADWAAAAFAGTEPPSPRPPTRPTMLTAGRQPFSFVYDGVGSGKLLAAWDRAVETAPAADRLTRRVVWTDPKTKLRVTAEVSAFARYPAAEWVLHFENGGAADTPILQDIQALDVELATGRENAVLHGLHGDDCSERSFQPFDEVIAPGGSFRMAPRGGRPSNGAFPFFNVEHGGRGLITAIGWSGQWAASLRRDAAGTTRLCAGMEQTRLRLRPGERIRGPRILLMAWDGDRLAAHNRFRRLMLFHHVPHQAGRPVALPIFLQGYDRYRAHPRWGNEAGQVHAAQVAAKLGCEFLWLDAAWFPGDFPNGVGNWTPKPQQFPRGLRPVSDACHKLGLKFIVWFEPERVAPGTAIARECPQFVFGGEKGGLFRLDDPAARRWLTDLLSRRIREFGMDWYRNDFNIDPLSYWRGNDGPDRQGMTEIRYVEGHYAMWDELRAARPGLVIDNCASGGRRIDLETCMRSVPLWQSDTACAPGHADMDQAQMCGLSLYLPFHLSCAWSPEAYVLRSAAAAGAITQFAFLDDAFPLEQARSAVAEVGKNRKYWYGDFYPLTPCTAADDQFIAWQLHRADLNAGIVLAFRRARCEAADLHVRLGGLDAKTTYAVEFIDEARTGTVREIKGRDMAAEFSLRIPQRRASLLVRYAPAAAGR